MRGKLRLVLTEAARTNQRTTVRGARAKRDDAYVPVTVGVKPVKIPHQEETLLLVTFADEPQAASAKPPEEVPGETSEAQVRQLEHDLRSTREDLRTTIEELETSNEELKVSNEEVMSMNEELQSTNEELETANDELRARQDELNSLARYQDMVLGSLQVGLIVLDRNLAVTARFRIGPQFGVTSAGTDSQAAFVTLIGLAYNAR